MGYEWGGECDFISIVRFFNKCSLFQDTVANMSSGPEPPFFKNLIASLIPNIADRAPIGKHFGDVLQPAKPKYRVVRLTGKSLNALRICFLREKERHHHLLLVVPYHCFSNGHVDSATG